MSEASEKACVLQANTLGMTSATERTCSELTEMLSEGGCAPTIDFDLGRITIQGCDAGWPTGITFCPFCGGQLRIEE